MSSLDPGLSNSPELARFFRKLRTLNLVLLSSSTHLTTYNCQNLLKYSPYSIISCLEEPLRFGTYLPISDHPSPQISCFLRKGFTEITEEIAGKTLHALCIKNVVQLSTFYTNTLINMYSKFGNVKYAQYVFDRLLERNEASWNNMMSGLVRVGWYFEAMRFFHHMCEYNVKPSSYAIASLLTACARSDCMIEEALQIHGFVVKYGLLSDVFVGTCFLNLYGTYGQIFEARKLFEEIIEPNIVSWTSLMVTYADNGEVEEVINIYQHLRRNGLYCNQNTISTIVSSCGMLGDKLLGYQVFGNVIKSGLNNNVSVQNSLINMFSSCGSMEEAFNVFNNMKERDTISWNSIITAFAHNGQCEESLWNFSWMRNTHTETNYITFSSLLSACGSTLNLGWGRGLHGLVVKSGLESNVCVCNCLLTMYSEAGKSKDAEFVFQTMPNKDLVSWNSMMACYVEDGMYLQAIKLFIDLLQTRKMNYVTFASAFAACSNQENIIEGKIVHALAILFGLHHNLIIGNTLVTMYGKFNLMFEAQRVCKTMPKRDEVTWNALIGGHADNEQPNEAFRAFNLMREEDIPVNYITIVNLLGACLSPDDLLKHGLPIHAHTIVTGFELDTYVQSSLITMYAKCGDLDTGNYIFNGLANKNSSAWNAIVAANAHYGPGEEALKLLAKMRSAGVGLDQFSFSVALAIIGNLAALDEGQQLHALAIKLGFESDHYVLNSIMDMYGKCGEIDDVLKILPQPSTRMQRSWNILISALARHGLFQQAREAFHDMLKLGLRPDHVTFVSLLSACNHGGLVDEGLEYYYSMTSKFSVPVGIEHCVCIVDLLGRCGRLAEAEAFVHKMPVPPNDLLWRSLLASCKIHGDMELGRKAAEHLLKLDPSDDSAYVLYSNVCATTRRWDAVENVRMKMTTHNIKKKPACSWVKLRNKVTSFGMGDKSHPQTGQIVAKLEELNKMIKGTGYMPDTSYALQDTDEEQKEHNLWNHSERIALAFGLINCPEGSPIRIFKNLRVCVDCHSVFKLVSKIIDRKIILRDAYRFHHFCGGKCSCSDYW